MSEGLSQERRKKLREKLQAEGFRAARRRDGADQDTTQATTDQRMLGRLVAHAGAAGMLTWAFPIPDDEEIRDRLRRALSAVVARRPGLRTTVRGTESGLERTLLPAESVFSPTGQEPTEVAALAATVIDPAVQPPLRARFVPGFMVLSTHHVAADERTWSLLLDELNAELRSPGAVPSPVSAKATDPAAPLINASPAVDASPAAVAEATERRATALRLAVDDAADLSARPDPFAGERRVSTDSAALRIALPVDQEWVSAVHRRAREAHTTVLSVLIQAATQVLSRRDHSGGSGVVLVGTPADVRDALGADAANADGDRVSIVPVAVPADADVAAVSDIVAEAVRDRCAGVDNVARALNVTHTPGRSPLIDAVVTHRQGDRLLVIDGVAYRGEFVHSGAAPFDAVFSFEQSDTENAVVLEFRTAALRPATALAVLQQWRDELAHPATTAPLDLPQVDTHAEDVVSAVAGFAHTQPDTRAVDDGTTQLTFQQVQQAVLAVAAQLTAHGVRPGDVVALRLHRSVHIPVAMLAALHIGAPFVCLDPHHPARRSELILTSAAPALLVDDVFITDALGGNTTAGAPPPAVSDPNLPAYVVFTSGTTGVPKGIVVSRGALNEVLGSVRATLGIGLGDRYLAASTLGFDISVVEQLLPLLAGAEVYVAQADFSTDIGAACAVLRKVQPTFMEATPSLWAEIINHDPGAVRGVCACAGGEELPVAVATRLRELNADVFNLYGPSETAIVATAWHVTGEQDTVRLGDALPTVGVEVCDPALRHTPDGALGELYLSGPQVGYGYLEDPGLTAAHFVAAPGGQRRYRTGDLVVRGVKTRELEYRGRSDEQWSLHGLRIERGDIEAALMAAPGVAAAAARLAGGRVVGFVVPDGSVADAELEARVLASTTTALPTVARPAAIVVLPQLPRTATGKVDRAQLPLPEWGSGARRKPTTRYEKLVVDTVQEVLNLAEPPAADADFRALGGHSLLAHRVALKLGSALGVRIAVRTVVEETNLAALAAACAAHLAEGGVGTEWEPAADTAAVPADSALPGQERIALAEQFDPEPGLYTIPLFAEIDGEVDAARLSRALTAVVAAHPVLRSALHITEDGTVEVSMRTAAEVAAHPIGVAERATTAQNLPSVLDELVRQPFPATAKQPVRAALIRVEDAAHSVLALLFHHAFFDEWSLDPFFADLAAAYDNNTAPGAVGERAPGFQRIQALTQLRHLRDVEFWAARRREHDATNPPVPFSRAALAAAGYAAHIATGHGPAIHRVLEVPAIADAANVVKAAVLLLLARAGHTPVFGMPVSGRHHPDLGEVVGYVGNTLPVWVADAARLDMPVRELLAAVRTEVFDVAEHSSIPLEELAEAASTHVGSLFQVIVDHRVGAPPLPYAAEWASTLLPIVPPLPKFPVTVVHTEPDAAAPVDTPHRVDVLFSGAAFEQGGADMFATALADTIAQIATHLDSNVGAIGLAGVAEPTQQDVAEFVSVPELLDQQFSQHRDEPMLSSADTVLTGGQLQREVHALADAITAALGGDTAGKVVALHRNSRFGEVVGILGVLAAGAAFTVLRHDDPIDRLAAIMGDAAVSLILSDNPNNLPASHPPVLSELSDALPNGSDPHRSDPPRSWPAPQHPAYLVFTSGTTGRPKGVLVDHLALSHLKDFTFSLFEHAAANHGAQRPRLVSIAPMAFDVGLLEVVSTFCMGGHLYVAADSERIGAGLLKAVTTHRSTHFAATPTVLGLVDNPHVLAEDIVVFSGAEPLPADLAARWSARHRLVNLYGPTEATVNAIHSFVSPHGDPGVVPIGVADPHVTAVVLDAALQPTPIGMVGELWLAGPKLALGYPAQPELTATMFVAAPDHLHLAPGARMYRTGDMAVRRADGQLVCLGRVDDQLKIRGLRIEPAEIEAALRVDSLVDNARVVRVPASVTGERDVLAAAVVSAAGELSGGQLQDIRQRVASRLPRHLVPQRVVQVAGLPMTSNGKADRPTTVAMVAELLQHSPQVVEPAVQVAAKTPDPAVVPEPLRVLMEEVAHLLGINPQQLRAEDDFLQLGGDSILALQLVARLKDRGWEAGAREIFDARTLGELANVLVSTASTASASDASASELGEQGELALDLSDIDEEGVFAPIRVAAEHIAAAPDSVFAQSTLLSLPPILSGHTGMLVGGLVARHPALRTRITAAGECETLAESHAFEGDAVSLRGMDPEAAAQRLKTLRRELAENLDVRTGVLLAAAEVASDAGPLLVLVAHHHAVDAASWVQLIADMNALLAHAIQNALDFTNMPDAAGTSPRAGSVGAARAMTLRSAAPYPPLPLLRARIAAGSVSAKDVADTAQVQAHVVPEQLSTALVERFGHGVELRDALVRALAGAVRAVDPWGPATVTVDVEEHGRGGIIDPRSVGWWTQVVTLVDEPGQLRELPPAEGAVPPPERSDILLNHLGALFQDPTGTNTTDGNGAATAALPRLTPASLPHLPTVDTVLDGHVALRNALSITSQVEDGLLRLTFIHTPHLVSAQLLEHLYAALLAELNTIAGAQPTDAKQPCILPATPTQEGMFYLEEQQASGVCAYLTTMTFTLSGPLRTTAVLSAWSRLLRRHPGLQSRFMRTTDGTVVAVLDPTMPVAARTADTFTDQELYGAFDITTGPLARMRITQHDPTTHVIDVVFHHIVVDGWSAPILVRDFLALLDPAVDLPTIDPTPLITATTGAQAKQQVHEALPHWRKALRGAQPTTLVVGGTDTGAREELRLRIDAATSTALTAVARREHVTVAALLHGAWAAVLAESTGQQQVSFGSVVSGRPMDVPGVADAVGLFATTIPIAVSTADAHDRFGASRAAANLLLLGAQNPPPLATLQRLVRRDGGDVFDSLLVIENYPLDQQALFNADGLSVVNVSFRDGTHYPVMVVAHIDEQISLRLAVAEGVDLVGGYRVADLAAALERQLRLLAGTSVVADSVRGIPMVGPRRGCAGGEPGAHVRFTSADTEALVHAIAVHLRSLGIGPGDRVGVALPRGVDQLCATLAVWLVGAATMPVEVNDQGVLTQRSAQILDAADPAVIIDEQCVDAAETTHRGARFHIADRTRVLTPDDAAYVVHTSGTTGVPKGVVMPWRVLDALVSWQQRSGTIPAGTVIAHFAPDQFDVAFQELATAVHGGHTIVVVTHAERNDMAALAEVLDQHGVDVLFATSTVLNALAREHSRSHAPSLSVLIQAGEALRVGAQLRQWCSHATGPALFNQYGPSETHVVLATGDLSGEVTDTPSLGVPLDHVTALVLDQSGNPVAVDEPGELYIGGAIADGYLGDPDGTAAAFPTNVGGLSRAHRTGDVVVRRADGRFDYVGRADDQLKIRGVRVSPAEVAAIARTLPGVSDAAAVDVSGVLCVAVVPAPGQRLTEAEVREHYEAHTGVVDSALVPERIMVVSALPMTVNAKTDLRALRAWFTETTNPAQGATAIAPAGSATADLVAAIMADVLTEQEGSSVVVGVDDDFLALGGHSLSATRLGGRLGAALGVPVSLRTIVEGRSPRAIAAALSDTQHVGGGGVSAQEFAQQYAEQLPTPGQPALATPAQRRFWALSRVNPADITYNLPLLVRLSAVDAAAAPAQDSKAVHALSDTVERALQGLVSRHESLRTLLVGDVSGPQQLVLAPEDAAQRLRVRVTASEAEFAAHQTLPFALATDLPLRAALYADDQGVLLSLVVHHSACDGWSLPIVLGDLEALWSNTADAVEPAPSSAAIMAVYQYLWQSTGQAEVDRDYWREQLSELPQPMPLPLDRPRHPDGRTRGGLLSLELADADLAALHDAARALDATPFMVFHAAVAAMLQRMGCGDDIVLATPVSGRQGGVDETAVGCFVNLLVLRTSLTGNPRFRDVVARVRATTVAASEHAAMPFDVLVRELASGGSQAHHPLASVGIGLQNLPKSFPAPAGYTATVVPQDPKVSRFDINFDVFVGTDDLAPQLVAEFNAELFDQRTIERFLQRIVRVLHAAATHADTPLHQLPVLLDDERALLRCSSTSAPVVADATRNLVRGIVTSGEVLTEDGTWISAALLRQRIDALAASLVDRGVGPGDMVGVWCRRNVGQLVAQLAVLRTGAAYVPILPDTPAPRLAAQVAECGIEIALCTHPGDAHAPEAVTVLPIGVDGASISAPSSHNLPQPDSIPGAAPAYVLFTSGSTGTPKGVLVSRDNVAALLAATAQTVPVGQSDVLLALSPFAFDVTGWEYLAPLAGGGRLIIADDAQYRDPRAIAQLMLDHAVTCCEATPGLWSLIAEATTTRLDGVRAVISGEELPPSVCGAVLDTGAQVWNLYGPTEATVFATAGQQSAGRVDIGTPLPGMQVRVLDDALVPVAEGAIGDLYLVGPQVAFGYVGRPELTAAAFVADPGGHGQVMYRTGDLVRRDAAGRLRYVGRRDQQVQIRGHRVEIGDVVSALLTVPEVKKAAAKVLQRGSAKTLVGYVVTGADTGAAVDVGAILRQIRHLLPDYLTPAQLVVVPELPLTANGKVNIAALPDPEPEQWQAPETDTEKLLAGIVAELLDSDIPGRNQGFISLGGDSITAIRLAARAAEKGLPITVQDVLVSATIAELGALADSRPTPPVGPVPAEPSANLSGLSDEDLSQVLDAFELDGFDGESFGGADE